MNMNENKEGYIRNLSIIFHVCLVIFIVAVTTSVIFKFYDYRPSHSFEPRSYVVYSTTAVSDYKALAKIEGQERLAYMLSVFISVVISFSSFFLSKRYLSSWLRSRDEGRLQAVAKNLTATSGFYILMSVLLVMGASNFFLESAQNQDSYDQRIAIYTSFYPIISALAVTCFVIYYAVIVSDLFKKRATIVFLISSIILALFITSYALFDEYSLEGYSINFSPVAYPIVQTFLGKMPLIDLKSHYGLHPYFLAPFLHLLPANVFGLSILLSIPLLVSILAVGFCFFSIIENKLLAFVGFVTFLCMQNLVNFWWPLPSAVIFQYEAIRALFPSLLLGFCCIFLKKPTVKKYYSSLLFFACGTMWNLDAGIPTFLTLVIVLGYEKWFISRREKFDVKSIVRHFAQSGGILAILWLSFWLFLRVKYGQWPISSWLVYGQNAAFEFGYSMLPIKKFELWYIAVLIYVIGYVMALHNFFTKKYFLQDNFVVISTILGIGLFSYFIGRSHSCNVLHCAYPAVILLTIFADKFCATLRKEDFSGLIPKFKIEAILYILPLLFLSYFFVIFWVTLFSHPPVKEHFITKRFITKPLAEKPYWIKESEFIKNQIGEQSFVRDDVLILNLADQDYYFSLELRASFPLSFVNLRHMFYVEELNQLKDLIKSKKKKWVILFESEPKDQSPMFFDEEFADLKALLAKYYKISAQSQIDSNDKVIIYSAP